MSETTTDERDRIEIESTEWVLPDDEALQRLVDKGEECPTGRALRKRAVALYTPDGDLDGGPHILDSHGGIFWDREGVQLTARKNSTVEDMKEQWRNEVGRIKRWAREAREAKKAWDIATSTFDVNDRDMSVDWAGRITIYVDCVDDVVETAVQSCFSVDSTYDDRVVLEYTGEVGDER